MGWRGGEHVQGGRLGRQSGLVNPVVLIGRVRFSQEKEGSTCCRDPLTLVCSQGEGNVAARLDVSPLEVVGTDLEV